MAIEHSFVLRTDLGDNVHRVLEDPEAVYGIDVVRPETLGALRFGFGPVGGRQADAGQLLTQLQTPDPVTTRFPVGPTTKIFALRAAEIEGRRAIKAGRVPQITTDDVIAQMKAIHFAGYKTAYARVLSSQTPFFERLVWFWDDHFTVVAAGRNLRASIAGYTDEAIRPNVTGRFADLLKAVVTHPTMLLYLDQHASIGPNSQVGRRRKKGLNENLAREVLELHTLGVGGPYSQADVRQLAELFTGMTFDHRGFRFDPGRAEPSCEIVLGTTYGAGLADPRVINDVLEDLAMHPVTARHLARKLAVHFVSDEPPEDLVASLEAAYLNGQGQLMPVYEALLAHPESWSPEMRKARQPREYLAGMLTALRVDPQTVMGLEGQDLNRVLTVPLNRMGQPYLRPFGPDGWPEAADYWITAKGLAARIKVAARLARDLGQDQDDPMAFLEATLGDAAGPALRFAAGAAETKADAITLVLASTEMNRR